MIRGSHWMDVSNYFILRSWTVLCIFSSPLLLGDTTQSIDREFDIQDLRRRLDKIESGIIDFKASFLNSTKSETTSFPSNSLKKVSASQVFKLNRKKQNISGKRMNLSPTSEEDKLTGFYILPFGGMQSSSSLAWNTFFGSVEVDLKNGPSTGLRFGYNWYNLFTELEFSYLRNDIKGINQPLDVSGEIDGFGYYLSSGGRFNFNDSISGFVGTGVGGVNQQFQLSLYGVSIEQNEFLFGYQVFSGLEFRPLDSTSIGFRYRWLYIDKMDLFSSRDLHLLELYLGYLF
ncbi:porin family protein [Opitutales bacterium]|nr:porin family protein [Opitutales bacterium]